MLTLRRLLATLRTVSGDRRVTLRLGPQACFVPRLRLVEVEEEVLGWDRDEGLALVAHEGSHVRLSLYFEQLPPEVLEDREQMTAVNVLEDARVDRWTRHHWPGLRDGFSALDDRAFGLAEAAPGRELLELGEGLLPEMAFVWALRAATTGRAWGAALSDEVVEAVRECQAAAWEALDEWPRQEPADPEEVRQHGAQFARCMTDVVLPRFRALRRHGREELAARLEPELAEEVVRGSYETGDSDGLWRPWADEVRARSAASAVKARPTRRARQTARARSSVDLWRAVEPQVAAFASDLRAALRENEEPYVEAGFPTGRRLDLREAFLLEADPRRYDRVWRRPTERSERIWRLCLVADVSDSMRGAPMQSLARMTALALAGAERVGFDTALVLFGQSGDEPVTALKDFKEPLSARRDEISAHLGSAAQPGPQTPLAEALTRARTLVEGEPDGETVVVVVTDGAPTALEFRFFASPVQVVSSDDQGRTGRRSRLVQGRRYMYLPAAKYESAVRSAVRRVSTVPGVHLVGVGVGKGAKVDDWFTRAARFDDFRLFARGFPRFLAKELSARVR